VPALKKLGLVKISYFLLLLLIPVVLTFLYVDKTIDLLSWLILSVASLAFMGLNLHDQKVIMKKKEKNLMEKAEGMIRKKEWTQAIATFNEVLSYNRSCYPASMGKGYCFRSKTDYINAIESYKEAVGIKHDLLEAHFLLGICYFKERMMKEALASFERVIAINADYLEAYLFLGDIQRFWGDRDLAKQYYEAYISRCQDDNMKVTVSEKLESTVNGFDTAEIEEVNETARISASLSK
jgi:tetratricopeptide (TPR) repeat protein